MIKKLGLTLIISSQIITAAPFGYDQDLAQKIADFKKSYAEIGIEINQGKIYAVGTKYNHYRNGLYTHTTTEYQAICTNETSKNVFEDYKKRLNALYYKFVCDAIADGLITGGTYAVINNLLHGKLLSIKNSAGLLASSLAIFILQNRKATPLDYYEIDSLKNQADLKPNILKFNLIFAGALIGYVCTNLITNQKGVRCLINTK